MNMTTKLSVLVVGVTSIVMHCPVGAQEKGCYTVKLADGTVREICNDPPFPDTPAEYDRLIHPTTGKLVDVFDDGTLVLRTEEGDVSFKLALVDFVSVDILRRLIGSTLSCIGQDITTDVDDDMGCRIEVDSIPDESLHSMFDKPRPPDLAGVLIRLGYAKEDCDAPRSSGGASLYRTCPIKEPG